jgi:hypothetical protein
VNITLANPDVFVSTPGSVMKLSQVFDSGFYVYLYGANPAIDTFSGASSYEMKRCILTGISDSSKENVQFRNTLSNFIFMYAFGSQIAETQVQGVAFLNGECDGRSGISSLYEFFERNKVSVTQAPMTLTLASFGAGGNVQQAKTFKTFLVGMNVSLSDASNHLANFTLSLARAPG